MKLGEGTEATSFSPVASVWEGKRECPVRRVIKEDRWVWGRCQGADDLGPRL